MIFDGYHPDIKWQSNNYHADNFLTCQDTDERHTALIAAVNNNDVKVAFLLSSCPLIFSLSSLQILILINVKVVDALIEHPQLDMNKRSLK